MKEWLENAHLKTVHNSTPSHHLKTIYRETCPSTLCLNSMGSFKIMIHPLRFVLQRFKVHFFKVHFIQALIQDTLKSVKRLKCL